MTFVHRHLHGDALEDAQMQGRDPLDDYLGDEEQATLDRLREKGSDYRLVARQPHQRERELHRAGRAMSEQDVLLELYPDRPTDSQVTPLGRRAA